MENAPPVAPQTVGRPHTEQSPIETALGNSIGLLVLPGRSLLALVPIWAVLCGACMAVRTTPAPNTPQALLALLLAIPIVGVLW
ncbi:MAG: hypothetical protein AB8I80_01285, partial [Anaerolineae bacterium]